MLNRLSLSHDAWPPKGTLTLTPTPSPGKKPLVTKPTNGLASGLLSVASPELRLVASVGVPVPGLSIAAGSRL